MTATRAKKREPLTRESVNRRLSDRGIILVGDLTNNHSKTGFQCPKGHIWSATPANVLYGVGCPFCSGNARLNKSEINSRLKSRGITMLDEYENQKVKARFKCRKGHIWIAAAGSVLYNNGCPTCAKQNAGHRTRLSSQEITKRLSSRGILLIGDYKNANTKTLFQCESEHTWFALPGAVLRGSGCPHCAGNVPLSEIDVIARLAVRGIELAEDYRGGSHQTLFRCKKEGHTWKTVAANVIQSSGCPHCLGQTPLSKEIVNKRIADRGFLMIGEYKNSDTKTQFTCSKGHVWEATPYHVSRKDRPTGCAICSGMAPLSTEIVNERIRERGLVLVEDFVTNTKKVKFKCNQGHIWSAKPNNVLNGKGCPECAVSTCDNDVFYLWIASGQKHIELKFGEFLVKFGRTSERLKKKRILEVASDWKAKPNIIAMVKTVEPANVIEERVSKIGRKLNKSSIKRDGWTEFRVVKIKELLKLLSIASDVAENKIVWDTTPLESWHLI